MTRRPFVAGVSHRTAPVELRERLAPAAHGIADTIAALRAAGLPEVMLLATCNRIEIYGAADRPDEAARVALATLSARQGVAEGELQASRFAWADAEAVRHCFRVAASLDSMIVGEPQILGQVKAAFTRAQECGGVGPVLHGLLSHAFSVAKRVRAETELGRHAVSVPSVAVELAGKVFSDLGGRRALLVGSGEMGALAARHLVEHGVRPLYVTNRTAERAQALADAIGGIAVPFDAWSATLADVDIVVTAAAVGAPIVSAEEVRRARRHRSAPLLLIDIAVPRNVDPAVNALASVFCYDVDDLQQVAAANAQARAREAERAAVLVEQEVVALLGRLRDRAAAPTIVSLREKLEGIRRDELEQALRRLPAASPELRSAMEAMTLRIMNKILHPPVVALQASCRDGRAEIGARAAELFGLDDPRGLTG